MKNRAVRGAAGVWVLIVASMLHPACGAGAPEAPERVVLVTVDTLRADHLGCYGYLRDTAPFLCELASRGHRFDNALASGSHTAPTHASLFTSLQPVQHAVRENGQSLDPALLTMAEVFDGQGYETAAFTSVGFLRGVADGFATVDARARQGDSFHRPADATVSAALRWLRRQRQTDRFFVWIHLYDVHEWERAYVVDPRGRREIEELPVTDDDLFEFLRSEHGAWFQAFDNATLLEHVTRYDAQIRFADRELRRFHRALGELDLGAGTLWVVTADHGEGLGSHGYMGHGRYLYNEQLRVPLLIVREGAEVSGATVPDLVRHVDLLPTLAELVGAPGAVAGQLVPMEGLSLLPLLQGESWSRREPLAWAERRPARPHWDPGDVLALQDARFKYIYRSEGSDELYDLRDDPLEQRNLADADAEIAARMRDRLLGMYAEMAREGEGVAGTGIDESMIEELRALGYIQ